MDVLNNADKIERMINEIETLVAQIPDSAIEKANGTANYDRAIAITILKLKNGEIKEMEDFHGETIQVGNLPATLIQSVAKGICYKESFDKEASDAIYKGLITQVDARKSQLNGYQSLFKVIQ